MSSKRSKERDTNDGCANYFCLADGCRFSYQELPESPPLLGFKVKYQCAVHQLTDHSIPIQESLNEEALVNQRCYYKKGGEGTKVRCRNKGPHQLLYTEFTTTNKLCLFVVGG